MKVRAARSKNERARRGPCPCIRAGERWHDRHRAPTLQRRGLRVGDTVETKRAAIRFLAVRMRSLNDPRQSSLPTVQTVTPLTAQRFRDRHLNDLRSAARPTRSTGTDASVTFRPLILTPAQRVSHI